MSFSFSFIATNVKDALARLTYLKETQPTQVPGEIASVVERTLGNFRHTGTVKVSAHGHICNDSASYEPTEIHLEVLPITEAAVESMPVSVREPDPQPVDPPSVNETQATESQV